MQSTAIPFRSSLSPGPRPFLKWAGGKTQLLEHLGRFMTQFEGRYYEPFLGGAALFFSLRRRNVQLSDINEELISCYLAVRDFVDEVISELDRHKYDKDHFYAVRELDPMNLSIPARAAKNDLPEQDRLQWALSGQWQWPIQRSIWAPSKPHDLRSRQPEGLFGGAAERRDPSRRF